MLCNVSQRRELSFLLFPRRKILQKQFFRSNFCLFCFQSTSPVFGRYNSEMKTVKVGDKYAVQVNFTLTRKSSVLEEGKVPDLNMADTDDPITKEFETLIKNLSAENGLERLLLSSADVRLYRYRPYNVVSMFLRGLNLNYPHITNLTR